MFRIMIQLYGILKNNTFCIFSFLTAVVDYVLRNLVCEKKKMEWFLMIRLNWFIHILWKISLKVSWSFLISLVTHLISPFTLINSFSVVFLPIPYTKRYKWMDCLPIYRVMILIPVPFLVYLFIETTDWTWVYKSDLIWM